jgi:hypothetical protein
LGFSKSGDSGNYRTTGKNRIVVKGGCQKAANDMTEGLSEDGIEERKRFRRRIKGFPPFLKTGKMGCRKK